MLDFLKRLFGGSEPQGGASAVVASDDLERIEEELEQHGQGRGAARLLNRAGDLYLAREDRDTALRRYGAAIDAYLQAGEYDNAMAVCRKIIRVVPEVIRTRRTLAWLCLGKGFLEIAREHIEAYTEASVESDLRPLAVQQIQLMAQYVEQAEFREFLAEQLERLGDEGAAGRVRMGRANERVKGAGWTPVVFGAMLTPDELWLAVEKGVDIKAPADQADADEFESLLFDPEAAKNERGSSEQEASDKTG